MEVLTKERQTAGEEIAVGITQSLYEAAFLQVARFVGKMGGSMDEAKDIFHDSLVIYQEKMTQPTFTIQAVPQVYVLGIAKHLWLRKYKSQMAIVSLDSVEQNITIPDDFYPSVNSQRLLHMLERTGRRCLELLRSFYFEKLTVAAMKTRLGYQSEHSASVQKYKCLEKVRDFIKTKAMTYEDFVE